VFLSKDYRVLQTFKYMFLAYGVRFAISLKAFKPATLCQGLIYQAEQRFTCDAKSEEFFQQRRASIGELKLNRSYLDLIRMRYSRKDNLNGDTEMKIYILI